MKNVLMIGLMILIVSSAFAQSGVQNDPQYSSDNYKHPNKAKYAKEHNLDKRTRLKKSEVSVNENYKQSFNSPTTSEKVFIAAKPKAKTKKNKSYKHPYGL